jgi:uncharacterized protein YdaL
MKDAPHGTQKEEWNKVFRNLLADIKNQQCVLLTGPEIAKIGPKAVNQTLKEHLLSNNSTDIAHYYARDGFFLFRDKVAKEDVQRDIKFFYSENLLDAPVEPAIYKQIAEIPFHLIISITPDSYLSDTCYRYGIKHRFSYFQSNGEIPVEVEEPSAASGE